MKRKKLVTAFLMAQACLFYVTLLASCNTEFGSDQGLVTVSQLNGLPAKCRVSMQGHIDQSLWGGEYFTFRDSTGEISVEIDREVWQRSSIPIGASDRVEIHAEVERQRSGRIEVDVKSIRKI